MTYEQLETAALKLPYGKRVELAYLLVVSLESRLEQEPDLETMKLWKEEAQRRCLDVIEGRAELISAEEVFKLTQRELPSPESEQS